MSDSPDGAGTVDDTTGRTVDDTTGRTVDDTTEKDTPGGDENGGGFLLTERNTEKGLLVAVCDAEVLGDTFENGDVSLTVNEAFYGGDRAGEESVITSLRGAQVANVVGERAVAVAVEAGIIDADTVLEVGATRHAQLVRL
jgi:hypothetical protein